MTKIVKTQSKRAAKRTGVRKPVHDGTARMSLHVLIRWYTRRRDWFMVERLMNDLGNLDLKKEMEANG